MKHIQKSVLIPIERWEKIGDSMPIKEVLVKSVPLKNVQKNISHQKKMHLSQVKKVKNQQGLEKTQMFSFLNLGKRKKALKLFKYIMKFKTFSLTPDSEIIKNGKTLHNTNIVERITHAVQNVSSSSPTGMKYFYQMLKKKNIPENYIYNKIGRKIMNKLFLDETLSWRPPGCLSKIQN